jgi:hypothetical protein
MKTRDFAHVDHVTQLDQQFFGKQMKSFSLLVKTCELLNFPLSHFFWRFFGHCGRKSGFAGRTQAIARTVTESEGVQSCQTENENADIRPIWLVGAGTLDTAHNALRSGLEVDRQNSEDHGREQTQSPRLQDTVR